MVTMKKIISFLKKLFGIKQKTASKPEPVPLQETEVDPKPIQSDPVIIKLPEPNILPPAASAPVPPTVVEVPLPAPPVEKPSKPEPVKVKTLKDLTVIMGSALKEDKLNDQKYTALITGQFKSGTSENAWKLKHMLPELGKYNFKDADAIYKFVKSNGLRMHAHCDIWGEDRFQPKWLLGLEKDPEKLLAELDKYFQTTAARYKVDSRDVLNEIFDNNGKIKDSVFKRSLGNNWPATMLKLVHKHDPNSLKFYNDYNLQLITPRIAALQKLVDQYKKDGVPLHGIGSQMHINQKIDIPQYRKALKALASTGLMIHLSELDIAAKGDFSDTFKAVYEGYKEEVPEKQQFGITVWAPADRLNNMVIEGKDYTPALFNNDYSPKPAVKALIDLIK